MRVSQDHVILFVSLMGLSGCIGMRTPLDDASTARDDGSTQAMCGSTVTIDTTPARTDILIVLDRSTSMVWSLADDRTCSAGATNCTSRLDAVVPAIGTIVTDNPDINWGLSLFPASETATCTVASTPQVAIGSNSAAAIKSQLASLTTSRSTPTAAAIAAATTYLKTVNDTANRAILLATDGLPNCGGGATSTDDMTGASNAAAAAKKAGFPTYVIGLGPNVGNLNGLAQAGGTASFYPVTSTVELNNALKRIAKAASLTCTFKANKTPPDNEGVAIYVDNSLVARDDGEGWMFDPKDPTNGTIVLTGTTCQTVLAGESSQVQIVFGCMDAGV